MITNLVFGRNDQGTRRGWRKFSFLHAENAAFLETFKAVGVLQ